MPICIKKKKLKKKTLIARGEHFARVIGFEYLGNLLLNEPGRGVFILDF